MSALGTIVTICEGHLMLAPRPGLSHLGSLADLGLASPGTDRVRRRQETYRENPSEPKPINKLENKAGCPGPS
jgi:hypothetical protein